MDDGDGATLSGFGRNMAHKAAIVGAGEPAVGDQGGGLGQAAAVEVLHGLVHLAHTGAALGALVADDHHMTVMDLTGQNGLLGGLLRVEADGLALEMMQALVERAGLGDAGVGSQIAPQHRHAAGIAEGIVQRVVDKARSGIEVLVVTDILRQRVGGDGHNVRLQHGLEVFHQAGHAAVLIEIHDAVLAGGVHLGKLGRGVGEGVKLVQHLDAQLRLISDGSEVHDGVGGAAHGEAGLDGISDRTVGDDLAGGDVLLHQLHDLHAGLLRLHHPNGRGGGSGAAVRQSHAHGLGQCAHGVGGTQIGAGAAAGTGGVLQRDILLLGDLTGGEHTVSLGAGGLVSLTSVELHAALHGAAGQEDAGNIQTGSSHQHTGNDLIAASQQHQTVKQVDLGHGFDGVGDQLTGGHDEMHTVMSLAHAVTAADHAELNGGTAGPVDAVLHPLGDLTQVVVTGNAFAPCVGNADDGALQVLGGKAHGLVGGAVVLVAQALQNMFTAVHKAVPPVFRISEFCSCAMRERRQLPFLLSACIIKSRKRYYKSSKTLSTFL